MMMLSFKCLFLLLNSLYRIQGSKSMRLPNCMFVGSILVHFNQNQMDLEIIQLVNSVNHARDNVVIVFSPQNLENYQG